MIDYPCGKFGDCNFSRFGPIVWIETHTSTQTDTDERFIPATIVGMSNEINNDTGFHKDGSKALTPANAYA